MEAISGFILATLTHTHTHTDYTGFLKKCNTFVYV